MVSLKRSIEIITVIVTRGSFKMHYQMLAVLKSLFSEGC